MKKHLLLLTVILALMLLGCGENTNNETKQNSQPDSSRMGQFDEMSHYVVSEVPYTGEDIPTLQEIHQMYSGVIFSMDDFSDLEPGTSTIYDIDNITPYYLSTPYAIGNVFQYPAAEGNYIYIVCADTVQAIYMTNDSQFAGVVEFANMMENPSLRPETGRWK